MRPSRHWVSFVFVFLFFLSLSVSSCRQEPASQEKSSQTYASLFIRYIAPQSQLKVTAAFREGDSLSSARPVELPGGVQYQGQLLEKRRLPGQQVRYQVDQRSAFLSQHRFQFKGADGKAYTVPLEFDPIDSFSVVGGTASRSRGMTLYIKGEEIDEGESIVLLFSDAANKATTITLTNPGAKETFPIAGLRLQKLQPGPYQVYLVKKSHREITQDGLQAVADIEYYTAEKAFLLTE